MKSTGLLAKMKLNNPSMIIRSIPINKIFLAFDLSIILNVLKYGDFHVIDENLLHRYNKGSHSIIGTMRKYDISLINIIFLEFPFTFWCLKNLGTKIFFKNFGLIFNSFKFLFKTADAKGVA